MGQLARITEVGEGPEAALPNVKLIPASAVARHKAGDAAASTLYRSILSADPSHGDVLHLLGVTALQAGATEAAGRLERLPQTIHAGIPGVELANDQPFRLCILAFRIPSDAGVRTAPVRHVQAAGAEVTVSSNWPTRCSRHETVRNPDRLFPRPSQPCRMKRRSKYQKFHVKCFGSSR